MSNLLPVPIRERPLDPEHRENGSALVMAIFVLVVLTGMGAALLFMAQNEVRMSQADVRDKEAFYLAEAGLEDARSALYNLNKGETFDNDLAWAAGPDGVLDFDPTTVTAVRDANGNVTGFTGYGDDRPLNFGAAAAALGRGMYAAFLTNDWLDNQVGMDPLDDTNDRVMITGVGGGADGSMEIVQAVIELRDIIPSIPPATITLLGPNPVFAGGSSAPKQYSGDDCDGAGIAGMYVPIVGTIGSSIGSGIYQPGSYDSGAHSGYATAAPIDDDAYLESMGYGIVGISPEWSNCLALRTIVEEVRLVADVVCYPPAACVWPPSSPSRVIFIDGDWSVGPTGSGDGMLFVTGSLTMHGQSDWRGLIFVVGKGQFLRNGAGNGYTSGGIVVADIAGPDNIYGTGDDCTGGVDGFGVATFDENGGGTGDTTYCSTDLNPAIPVPPYDITEFLQR